jgi:membrane-anchored glycerophosphoryl diester phosphodiesterase (GDPDase)
MVLEKRSFREALARSRQLARNNPTELGVAFMALGVVNYLFGLLTFAGAYRVLELYSDKDQVLAALLAYTLLNLYFAVSGYLKTTYFTCFYLWARECERHRTSDIQLAPYPLSAILV